MVHVAAGLISGQGTNDHDEQLYTYMYAKIANQFMYMVNDNLYILGMINVSGDNK